MSSLPPQLTSLTHLTELSFCGNTLRNLPNGEIERLKETHVLVCTHWLNCDSVNCDLSNLQCFSSDFSALRQLKLLYVDGNCCLHCIPGSLVHAGVTLGVQECGVWTEEGEKGVVCCQECPAVLPLLELAARAVHRYRKGILLASICSLDKIWNREAWV